MQSRTVLIFLLCSSASLWAQQENQPGAGGRAGGAAGKKARPGPLPLQWLAKNQNLASGGFQDGSGKEAVAPTGLATIAFLGAGYTDRGTKRANPYATNVRQALRFLITRQDEHGKFGTGTLADHAFATLAMTEAYWMTRNPRYKKPAMEGLKHIETARKKGGVWSDIDTTGLCIMALKSGKFGRLAVGENAFVDARRWLDQVADRQDGRVAVGNDSARATAMGMLIRIFCGEKPTESPAIQAGAKFLLDHVPDAKQADQAYWWLGTLATFQVGGATWKIWSGSLRPAVEATKRGQGADQGHWNPSGEWGHRYGRVGAFSMMTLSLEIHYRYDRVFGIR